MNPATLQKINFHVDRITEILSGRIEELEKENEEIKRVKGLDLNKDRAARYLGMSVRHLTRLEGQYPDWLSFPISIEKLDEFSDFYEPKRRKR